MNTGFRGSLRVRRLGALLLALFVLAYLSGITYWQLGDARSEKSLIVLSVSWLAGVVALVLLARAWRRS